MATNKTITVISSGGTSKQFAPESANSDVVTNGVYRSLIGLDWGEVPRTQFLQARALRDGSVVRGGAWDARTIPWQMLSRVDPTAAAVITAGVEAVRDDEEGALNAFLLNPTNAPFKLQQARTNAAAVSVIRWIRAYPQNHRSWKWSPSDVEDGFVGAHNGPILVKSVDWYAGFPWFISDAAGGEIVTSSGNTLDNTDRSVTINNPGDVPCGLKVTITGASGTTTVVICNGYSTGSYSVPNNSLSIASVSPGGASYIVDWFGSDPTVGQAYVGATDYTTNVGAGSLIQLARGNNTIHYTTSSVVTSWQIRFDVYPLWGSP